MLLRSAIVALYELLAWSKYITFVTFVIVKKVTNRHNNN